MSYRILPVTPFQQNATLLWCDRTRKAALVDPGGDVDTLRAAVESEGLRLERILLTHGHLDHVGGAVELARSLGVPIEGPQEGDAFWLDALPEQADTFGFPRVEPFRPDRWLDEGDELVLGELAIDVFHCPGHTPGHLAFFVQEPALAVVGDVLFHGAVGRTDFPRGSHEQLIDSIRRKLLPLGDTVPFVPGHGPMSTLGDERRHNPFL